MRLGDPLVATKDFHNLRKGLIYRCIHRDGIANRVVLTWHPKPEAIRTEVTILGRRQFHDALDAEVLTPFDAEPGLPPWLSTLAGIDLEFLEERRRAEGRKRNLLRLCAEREDALQGILERKFEILTANSPKAAIRSRVKALKGDGALEPRHNTERVTEWALLYLTYGTADALYPATVLNGRWDRAECPGESDGYRSGEYRRLSTSAIEKCLAGYCMHQKKGRPLAEVWTRTLVTEFECKTNPSRRGGNYRSSIFHPEGLEFPSYYQFRYQLDKKYGKEAVQLALHGAHRTRQRSKTSLGKFSNEVSDYLEKVELDAYWVRERPRPDIPGFEPAALLVVEAVDVSNGTTVGIGFCEGAERGQSYLEATFSMAVGLDRLCEMLGVEFDPDLIPQPGLGQWDILDRGPGTILDKVALAFAVREIVGSYQGQSKPHVETNHPKYMDIHMGAMAKQMTSSMRVVELARIALQAAIRRNGSKNVESRLSHRMKLEEVAPNPISVHNWQIRNGHTQARHVPFEKAVRNFLKVDSFVVVPDGLLLRGQSYSSSELRKSDLLDQCQGLTLKGYVHSIAAKVAWVEFKGRLVPLKADLPVLTAAGEQYVTLEGLAEMDEIRRRLKKEQRDTAAALMLEAQMVDLKQKALKPKSRPRAANDETPSST